MEVDYGNKYDSMNKLFQMRLIYQSKVNVKTFLFY